MKITSGLVAVLLIYLFYGTYLSRFDVQVLPKELLPPPAPGYHDYRGIINIHTKTSTGSGSVEEIIQSGQLAGLDFLFITDLNVFDTDQRDRERYADNLLVFVDGEYSYLNSRLLSLGGKVPTDLAGPSRAQGYFSDLLSQRRRAEELGLLILAHPLKPNYSWSGEFPQGLDGLELVNLKSVWQAGWIRSRLSFLWSLLIFPFNDRLALLRLFKDPVEEAQLWDQLATKRPMLAIAGADAEAQIKITDEMRLKYPSYQTLFSLVSNHLLLRSELTGEIKADRRKILEALRQGQAYVALDILGDPKGFYAQILGPKGEVYPIGSELTWQEGLELEVHLPEKPLVPFEIEIYRNGQRLMQIDSQSTRVPLHLDGNYRVKVRVIPTLPLPDGKQWIPWIFTNPFYVKKP